MIQRIQTVFLLLAAACTGSLFFISMGKLANEQGIFSLQFAGLTDLTRPDASEVIQNTWPLSVLIVLTTATTASAIFLYTRRVLQMRLCGINMGLMAGLSGLIWYTNRMLVQSVGGDLNQGIAVFLPLAAMVFTALAIRSIGRDEALIRSMDRLR